MGAEAAYVPLIIGAVAAAAGGAVTYEQARKQNAAVKTSARLAREAAAYPSFRWLTAGYFVCGFQVVFIGVHQLLAATLARTSTTRGSVRRALPSLRGAPLRALRLRRR